MRHWLNGTCLRVLNGLSCRCVPVRGRAWKRLYSRRLVNNRLRHHHRWLGGYRCLRGGLLGFWSLRRRGLRLRGFVRQLGLVGVAENTSKPVGQFADRTVGCRSHIVCWRRQLCGSGGRHIRVWHRPYVERHRRGIGNSWHRRLLCLWYLLRLLLRRWCYRAWRHRRVLHLLEHELNLSNLVAPATTAQEAEQGMVDGYGLLLLAQQTMRFCRFLAQLHQLIRFLNRQGIQIDAINRLVKVRGRGMQVAPGPVALTERVEAGESVIRVIEQHLELPDSIIPALLLLIEPTQEIAGIRAIKAAGQNLLAEVDSIGKTSLGLIRLCLP